MGFTGWWSHSLVFGRESVVPKMRTAGLTTNCCARAEHNSFGRSRGGILGKHRDRDHFDQHPVAGQGHDTSLSLAIMVVWSGSALVPAPGRKARNVQGRVGLTTASSSSFDVHAVHFSNSTFALVKYGSQVNPELRHACAQDFKAQCFVSSPLCFPLSRQGSLPRHQLIFPDVPPASLYPRESSGYSEFRSVGSI